MRNDANERAEMPEELMPTHEALTHLANTWSATAPSAERLTAFTRQLPAQHNTAPAPADTRGDTPDSARSDTPMRWERARRTASDRHTPISGRRLFAALVAAIVIVGLFAATLLRLAPSRMGHGAQSTPTITATPPVHTARTAEEPSSQPPTGHWTTIAKAQLIPAPSDGRVVYKTNGTTASVSEDGGATWRALKLPPFSQPVVTAESATLRVSDANPRVILLSLWLAVSSADPASCPPGSKAPARDNLPGLHGGILASGSAYCIANYASHDGGASWASMSLPSDVTYPPSSSDTTTVWQLGNTLYGLGLIAPIANASSLLVSHDLGVTWTYTNASALQNAGFLCSLLPSTGDSALYIVTSRQQCGDPSGATPTVWRSVNGGATWQRVSTFNGGVIELVAASPTVDGHGVWIYALREDNPRSPLFTLLVSADRGATWTQTPQLAQTNGIETLAPITGALADGSVVVAAFDTNSFNAYAAPQKTSFYAWRPGDAAWRQLATPLTANYIGHSDGSRPLVLTRGGPNAIDTLWVIEAEANYTPQTFITHAYPIR